MLQRFVTWIIRLCIVLLILIIVAGSYVGNVAYQEFRTAQWDHILGIENHTRGCFGYTSMGGCTGLGGSTYYEYGRPWFEGDIH